MTDGSYHPIDEYLSEDWIDDWARQTVAAVEAYLAKHAAFDAFRADGNPPPATA